MSDNPHPAVLPNGSTLGCDAFDETVLGWHVVWPEGKGARGFIHNRGPEWWQLAVARMHQGATVTEERIRAPGWSRDDLGRVARQAWMAWAACHPAPKPSWLVPYELLSEADKEADRQIAEAVIRSAIFPDPTKLEAWRSLLHAAHHLLDDSETNAQTGAITIDNRAAGRALQEMSAALQALGVQSHSDIDAAAPVAVPMVQD